MLLLVILWIIASAFITVVSRRTLKQPGSHGFYRFFAWEAILTLALLNIQGWFIDPFSPNQVISWILLFVSLIPLILGLGLLGKRGASRGRDESSANFAFENTTRLVTTGVYAYIRHPLYASLLCLTWGIYAKDPLSIAGILLALIASVFLYLTARSEEEENIRSFGVAYEGYMKKTWRFIPYVF